VRDLREHLKVARVRFFAQARDATGTREAEIEGSTVGDVLSAAVSRYGEGFARILETSAVWVNGDEAVKSRPVGPGDEIAVLPPVSGGA
jgi:molybdopterin synthase sulfur carrier subunit